MSRVFVSEENKNRTVAGNLEEWESGDGAW